MAKLFANSGDPDQMPHTVASDLGLHCLPITLLRAPDYNRLKEKVTLIRFVSEMKDFLILMHIGSKFDEY